MNKKQLIVALVMIFCIIAFSHQAVTSINSITPQLRDLNELRVSLKMLKDVENVDLDKVLAHSTVTPEVKLRHNQDVIICYIISIVAVFGVGGLLIYTLRDEKK